VLLPTPSISRDGFQQDDYALFQSKPLGSLLERSRYHRHYRPKLQVFRWRERDPTKEKQETGSLIGGQFTTILPVTQSAGTWEDTAMSGVFHGRVMLEVYALHLSRDLAYIVGVAPINSTLCNTFHLVS
jgi:hypothetical protein